VCYCGPDVKLHKVNKSGIYFIRRPVCGVSERTCKSFGSLFYIYGIYKKGTEEIAEAMSWAFHYLFNNPTINVGNLHITLCFNPAKPYPYKILK